LLHVAPTNEHSREYPGKHWILMMNWRSERENHRKRGLTTEILHGQIHTYPALPVGLVHAGD
jgi:hypothetical protein